MDRDLMIRAIMDSGVEVGQVDGLHQPRLCTPVRPA